MWDWGGEGSVWEVAFPGVEGTRARGTVYEEGGSGGEEMLGRRGKVGPQVVRYGGDRIEESLGVKKEGVGESPSGRDWPGRTGAAIGQEATTRGEVLGVAGKDPTKQKK